MAISSHEPMAGTSTNTAEARKAFTGYLGMVLALASWVIMFAGLFYVYGAVRMRFPAWPPPQNFVVLPLLLPGINTLVAVASSVALHLGVSALRRGKASVLSAWLAAAIVLGVAFLGLQWFVWVDLWRAGLRADSGIYGSVFYALTAFHAAHVVCGLGVLVALLVGALRGKYSAANWQPARLSAMFWHFVGTVWLIMYLTVYVL